jgi:hypothetical protein
MPHRYAVSLFPSVTTPVFIIAGTQDLTVYAAVVFSPVTSGTSSNFAVQRVHSVVGGSPEAIVGLDDPTPAALATAVSSPTSWTVAGRIGELDFVGPVTGYDLLVDSGPIAVASGNALFFQISGAASVADLNVYFEE